MSTVAAFRRLHETGSFVVPNPWDVGSATLLEAAGAPALATTSAGLAAVLGRRDQHVSRDELLAHVEALTDAVDIPVTVDAEDGYGSTAQEVGRTARLLLDAGAAGLSIEDYDASEGRIRQRADAVERVAAAVEAAGGPDGAVVTGRCEHHLYGVDDLGGTLERLQAYAEAGASCLYAPGLTDLDRVAQVVDTVPLPVNVMAMPGGPTVAALQGVGVRRVSVGPWLCYAAYGAAVALAEALSGGDRLPGDLQQPAADLLDRAWSPE